MGFTLTPLKQLSTFYNFSLPWLYWTFTSTLPYSFIFPLKTPSHFCTNQSWRWNILCVAIVCCWLKSVLTTLASVFIFNTTTNRNTYPNLLDATVWFRWQVPKEKLSRKMSTLAALVGWNFSLVLLLTQYKYFFWCRLEVVLQQVKKKKYIYIYICEKACCPPILLQTKCQPRMTELILKMMNCWRH